MPQCPRKNRENSCAGVACYCLKEEGHTGLHLDIGGHEWSDVEELEKARARLAQLWPLIFELTKLPCQNGWTAWDAECECLVHKARKLLDEVRQ